MWQLVKRARKRGKPEPALRQAGRMPDRLRCEDQWWGVCLLAGMWQVKLARRDPLPTRQFRGLPGRWQRRCRQPLQQAGVTEQQQLGQWVLLEQLPRHPLEMQMPRLHRPPMMLAGLLCRRCKQLAEPRAERLLRARRPRGLLLFTERWPLEPHKQLLVDK